MDDKQLRIGSNLKEQLLQELHKTRKDVLRAVRAVRRMSKIIDSIEISDTGEVTSDELEKEVEKEVQDEITKYIETPGSLEYFITHSLTHVTDLSTKYTVVPQVLYTGYLSYCKLYNSRPVSKAMMDRYLKRLGYKKACRKLPKGPKNVIIQVAWNMDWLQDQGLIQDILNMNWLQDKGLI